MIVRHRRTLYMCLRSAFSVLHDTNLEIFKKDETELRCDYPTARNLWLEWRANVIWKKFLSQCPSIVENGFRTNADPHPEAGEGLWDQDKCHSNLEQIKQIKDPQEHGAENFDKNGLPGKSTKGLEQLPDISKTDTREIAEQVSMRRSQQRTRPNSVDKLISELRIIRDVAVSANNSLQEDTEFQLAVGQLLDNFPNLTNRTLQKLVVVFQSDLSFTLAIFEWAKNQQKFKLNKYTLFSVINVVGRAKDFKKLQELSQNFESLVGEPPSVFVYTDVMKSYSLAQQFDDMCRVYREIIHKGVQPSIVTYSVLIGGLVAAGRVEEALEAKKRMEESNVKPNSQLYGDLIALCGKTEPHKAESLLETMKIEGVAPEAYHFNRVLAILFQTQQGERGVALFQRMVKGDGPPPKRVTYVTILDYYAKHGMVDEAKAVLDGIVARRDVELEERFYNIVMNMYVQHKRMKEAKALLENMVARGLKPNDVTYSTLIFGLLKIQKFEEATRMVKAMRKENIQLSLLGYTSIINLCIRCDNEEGVKKLLNCLDSCEHPNHDLFLMVLQPNVEGTQFWTEVQRRLDRLIKEDVAGRIAFLDALITSLSKVGLKKRAGNLWNKARLAGLLDKSFYETPTNWVLDTSKLSASTAEIALCFELLRLFHRFQNGEKVPDKICIVTGFGRGMYTNYSHMEKAFSPGRGLGSYTDHMYMTKFVTEKLSGLSSPFDFCPTNSGCLIAQKERVWNWLQSETVKSQLHLRDG